MLECGDAECQRAKPAHRKTRSYARADTPLLPRTRISLEPRSKRRFSQGAFCQGNYCHDLIVLSRLQQLAIQIEKHSSGQQRRALVTIIKRMILGEANTQRSRQLE